MTYEEAVNRANSGDVDCMIMLGDFYLNNKNLDNYEQMKQALPWYENAAKLGSARGAEGAMIIYDFFGMANRSLNLWSDAISEYQNAYNCGTLMQKLSNSDNTSTSSISEKKNKYGFLIAYCQYRNDDYSDALDTLTQIPELQDDLKSNMLTGLCSFNLENPDSKNILSIYESQELTQVFETLQNEEQELFLSLGYVYLTLFIRDEDAARAYNILSKGLSEVCFPKAKDFLSSELSHYKKKMFGGYQYCD